MESVSRLASSEKIFSIVVDNSEYAVEAESLRMKLEPFPRCVLLVSNRNLGYFGAANYAFDWLNVLEGDPDWFVVSNPDIKIEAPDLLASLDGLVEGAGKAPAVVAPAIISTRTARDENPYMLNRPSRARMRALAWLYSSYCLTFCYQALSAVKKRLLLNLGGRPTLTNAPTVKSIYAPHGAFVIFHKSFFVDQGGLDYPGFLFGEEIWVAEQCRRLGLVVLYAPTIWVTHSGHETTGIIKNPALVSFEAKSMKLLLSRYF
jgi:GT2 family glycosyltransferase